MIKLKILFVFLFPILVVLSSNDGCAQDSWKECFNSKRGEIRVNYINNSTFFYEENGQLSGIEFDIFEEFKRYVKDVYDVSLKIKYQRLETFSQIYNTVKDGTNGDFGACSISITNERLEEVSFSPHYMPDIEVMITSNNLPIFKDTLDFLNHAVNSKFLVVPNTTYEGNFLSIKNLGYNGEVERINDGTYIQSRLLQEDNLISFTELSNYFLGLKNGDKVKRQNVFRFERKGYGVIFPKTSDWSAVVYVFFREKQTIRKINKILTRYLGDDIQDLLKKVEFNSKDELLFLRKEKEVQELQIVNQELLQKQKQDEFNSIQEKSFKTKLYLIVGLLVVITILILILLALRIQLKSKEIIQKQKIALEESHDKLEKSYDEIGDSIRYAKRLQLAILPEIEYLKNNLGNAFVFFKPKNVVSGDFYWTQVHEGAVLYAVADCTGHGVPGAMISVVCSNALNRSVKEFGLKEPAEILNKTRELVIETFSKSGENIQDGMDIALISFQKDKCIYAGANSPLWIIRDEKWKTLANKNRLVSKESGRLIIEYKPNKFPVGKYRLMNDFVQHEIPLQPNDCLYIFSDGYADQFGGEKGRKFKYNQFRSLLANSFLINMNDQRKLLDQTFEDWKGNYEQVDDIAIIGLRV